MTKKNDYAWDLDYVAHGTAHYSKNWSQNDQREYNKWYYENVTKQKDSESQRHGFKTINAVQQRAIDDEILADALDYNSENSDYSWSSDKTLSSAFDKHFAKEYRNRADNNMRKMYDKYGAANTSQLASDKNYAKSAAKTRQADKASWNNGKTDQEPATNSSAARRASLEQRKANAKAYTDAQKKKNSMSYKIKEVASSTISSGKSAIDKALSSISSTVSKLTKR